MQFLLSFEKSIRRKVSISIRGIVDLSSSFPDFSDDSLLLTSMNTHLEISHDLASLIGKSNFEIFRKNFSDSFSFLIFDILKNLSKSEKKILNFPDYNITLEYIKEYSTEKQYAFTVNYNKTPFEEFRIFFNIYCRNTSLDFSSSKITFFPERKPKPFVMVSRLFSFPLDENREWTIYDYFYILPHPSSDNFAVISHRDTFETTLSNPHYRIFFREKIDKKIRRYYPSEAKNLISFFPFHYFDGLIPSSENLSSYSLIYFTDIPEILGVTSGGIPK